MPYLTIPIIARFGAFFFRAAEFEDESALLWVACPLLISAADGFLAALGLAGTDCRPGRAFRRHHPFPNAPKTIIFGGGKDPFRKLVKFFTQPCPPRERMLVSVRFEQTYL